MWKTLKTQIKRLSLLIFLKNWLDLKNKFSKKEPEYLTRSNLSSTMMPSLLLMWIWVQKISQNSKSQRNIMRNKSMKNLDKNRGNRWNRMNNQDLTKWLCNNQSRSEMIILKSLKSKEERLPQSSKNSRLLSNPKLNSQKDSWSTTT